MATTTYSLIGKQTVGSAGAASITFSNIPQTYTDLLVKVSGRSNNAQVYSNFTATFNGSSSGYSFIRLSGNGSSASSDGPFTSQALFYIGEQDGANATANTFSNSEFYIPNYTSSNYKSISVDKAMENNATTSYIGAHAALWSNTAAITSITITSDATIQQYSTAYLYGVSSSSTQNTNVPYASGGDVITTDGTYWYHAFKYSGTFTPLKGLSADILVVAGGGGGGGNYGAGGGGGAGGLLTFSAQALAANTGLTCTIGGGGAAGANSPGNATNGSDSQFGSLTLVKGGGGAGTYQNNGATGGSGGGGGGGDASTSGGSATSGQGYAGGGGAGLTSTYTAGGGGGAGGAGAAGAATNLGGNGGVGFYNSLTNAMGVATATGVLSSTNYYYAGGGGGGAGSAGGAFTGTGGTGGTGGGGAGASGSNNGTAGTANTGGGGGGTRQGNGAAGGSGIIIVRYAV